MRRGVSGRARTEFEQAVEAHPGDPLPYWNFAAALVDVGQPEQARELLRTALGLDPHSGPAHAEMARVESRAGHSGAALAQFAVAESLGVATPVFWANHGLELLNAGEYAAAEARLLRATALDSTRAATWNHLGVARLRLGRMPGALTALRRARGLGPEDEDIRFNLGNALVRSGQFAAAASLLGAPRPARADLLALCGMALRGAGRTAEAVPLLAEAVQKAPGDVNVLNNYGVVLAETGDVPRALDAWRRVLEIEPANRFARDNLAARGGR
jgi:Flp pilus assembly protein TadD